MTFGLKLALWYAELLRDIERVRRARETVRVGKISGAVGTFAHLDPAIEAASAGGSASSRRRSRRRSSSAIVTRSC